MAITKRALWARVRQEAEWHAVRESAVGAALMGVCGTPAGYRFDSGLALLPIDTNAIFGPVCAACAKLEGL